MSHGVRGLITKSSVAASFRWTPALRYLAHLNGSSSIFHSTKPCSCRWVSSTCILSSITSKHLTPPLHSESMSPMSCPNLPRDEVDELYEKLTTRPTSYSKPVRMYCDVGGVIQPWIESEKDLADRFPEATIITVLPSFFWGETVEMEEVQFWWNAETVELLAALSNSPDVDFVWFSEWDIKAPHTLDSLLGINSLGALSWDRKFSTGEQFKKEAIVEDQRQCPSHFVWIDALANLPVSGGTDVFAADNQNLPASHQHLNVTTNPNTGLTPSQLRIINAWVAEHS